MPKGCSPMRASPESFSSTRWNTGPDMSGRLYFPRFAPRQASCEPRIASSELGGLSQLESHEACDGDVLPEPRDGGLNQLPDRDLRIANRRLVEQAHLLVKAVEFSFHDFVDHLRGLVLTFHLPAIDAAL